MYVSTKFCEFPGSAVGPRLVVAVLMINPSVLVRTRQAVSLHAVSGANPICVGADHVGAACGRPQKMYLPIIKRAATGRLPIFVMAIKCAAGCSSGADTASRVPTCRLRGKSHLCRCGSCRGGLWPPAKNVSAYHKTGGHRPPANFRDGDKMCGRMLLRCGHGKPCPYMPSQGQIPSVSVRIM